MDAETRLPLSHVWQEQRGFRAAEIRNRAIAQSRGTYCIFLDGDCIARPDFISTHRRLCRARLVRHRQPHSAVGGADRDRSCATSSIRKPGAIASGRASARSGGINRTVPLVRMPLGPLRKLRWRAWRGARSCNLGIWRTDLDRVDGFDARLSAAGAGRIPICWCASCMPASNARTVSLPPACCICGIRPPTAPGCPTMIANSTTCARAIASRRGAVCLRVAATAASQARRVPAHDRDRDAPNSLSASAARQILPMASPSPPPRRLPWSTSATGDPDRVVARHPALLTSIVTICAEVLKTPAGVLPVMLVALAALGLLWADVVLGRAMERVHALCKTPGHAAVDRPIPPVRTRALGARSFSRIVLSLLLRLRDQHCCLALISSCGDVGSRRPACRQGLPDTKRRIHRLRVHPAVSRAGRLAVAPIRRRGAVVAAWRSHFLRTCSLLRPAAPRFCRSRSSRCCSRFGNFAGKHMIAVLALQSGCRCGRLGVVVAGANEARQHRPGDRAISVRGFSVVGGIADRFWTKSIAIVSDAPVFGHGTGSIRAKFEQLATAANRRIIDRGEQPAQSSADGAIQLGLGRRPVAGRRCGLSHVVLFWQPGLVCLGRVGVWSPQNVSARAQFASVRFHARLALCAGRRRRRRNAAPDATVRCRRCQLSPVKATAS